jgi:tetratricopeptide (TPR) repeat protein
VLHFEDPKGMNDPIPGQILGNVLRDHDCLRLAVLNACEGARQSNKDPFSGVAQSLCQQRLPAIVAMQFEISDAAAKTFAEEFYGAIAEGFPVDASVSEARKALFGGRFGQEWATPVLYMRSPNGLLFEVQRRAKGASGEMKPEVKAAPQATAAPVAQPEPPRAAPAPAPPPMPPPRPQPFVPSVQEEAERRRREAERVQHERAVFELEQARRRAADEQRQREERIRAEQQRAEESRRQLERERAELEARRKADEQRRQQEQQRREQDDQARLKREAEAREEQRREELKREERARREREAAFTAAAAADAIKVPPPPPVGKQPVAFAASVEPPKRSHRVRNVILGVVGTIVLLFVVLVIIGLIVDSNKSGGTKPPLLGESAASLVASADQFFSKGDYDHAIESYRSAIAKDDSIADAHSHLCNALAVKGENAPGQKGDYAGAVSECERAVQLTPTSAEAHNNLCNALVDKETFSMELKGNFDRAIMECNEALKLRPIYPEAYNNLCNAVGTRSEQPIAHPTDRSQAIADCRKAIQLKPTYPEAHKNLADLYRDAGYDALDRADRASAVKFLQLSTGEYRTAVAQNPSFSRAQSSLGAVLYKSASPDAITELNKAVSMDPSDYSAYFWRGYFYLNDKKDPAQAIADFNKVVELRPDIANGEYGLWLAYRAQGKVVEARQHLTRAYALDPNDKTISADYHAAILHVGDAAEAPEAANGEKKE